MLLLVLSVQADAKNKQLAIVIEKNASYFAD